MKRMNERREVFRRYADRRRALILVIHEILFNQRPGETRDRDLLEEIRCDFRTDGASETRHTTDPPGAESSQRLRRRTWNWNLSPRW